ncbi:DUF86 domain-containing protein [Pelotomaculum propionicicum]|uniref:DUF86 domain-containing protein n=1 Tax=Pelotomaculum propionicicum TaxID=258475 RepID=A0A4Y7RJ90_9FIRM|nr:hypothetical protein Pmgp_03637 [Pelotomaculum propionicicum]
MWKKYGIYSRIKNKSFADELTNMARFRNRLVHLYWEVDTPRVYYIIQTKLSNFEKFKHCVLEFLTKSQMK